MERMFTADEARQIAQDAARAALEEFSVRHPLPSSVTVTEAARMLERSVRTVIRMKLPRNSAGKIPYEAVVAARSAR